MLKRSIFEVIIVAFLPMMAYSQVNLPLLKGNSVIYDNDDHRDVYTDEYLLALSSIGEIDLMAMITTYSAKEYDEFVLGREQILKLAKDSGLKNLPQLFSGTNNKLERPKNNLIEDTKRLEIDASYFIVELANRSEDSKPIVVICGGQLTSIANAYLIDTTIADRIIVMGVFGADKIDYNAGLDSWAWTIVLSKFRVLAIPIGSSNNRGIVYMKPPKVPKEKIKSDLNQKIPLFQWMYDKKHPSNWLPNEGDYDGHPAILITRPDYVTEIKKFRVDNIDSQGIPVLIDDITGNIIQAEDANQNIATQEFWRVMKELNISLN